MTRSTSALVAMVVSPGAVSYTHLDVYKRQVAVLLSERAHDFDGAGNGHGDFNGGDAASLDRVCNAEGLLGRLGAKNGEDADLLDLLQYEGFIHFLHSFWISG